MDNKKALRKRTIAASQALIRHYRNLPGQIPDVSLELPSELAADADHLETISGLDLLRLMMQQRHMFGI